MKASYKVTPVTRYIVTRSIIRDSGERLASEFIGEFNTTDQAGEVMDALEVRDGALGIAKAA